MIALRWHTPEWFSVAQYAFCPDAETWEAERHRVLRREHVNIGDYPASGGLTTNWRERGHAKSLVTISEWHDDQPVELLRTLSHEAVHVASLILREMKEDEAGEETLAYMISGIAADLYADHLRLRRRI